MECVKLMSSRQFNNDFINLIISSLFSKFGMAIYTIALPLIVYDITKSGSLMAITFVTEFMPHIIFSLFGGALADRMSKRSILLYGDITSLFAVLFILVTFLNGIENIYILLIATFILSSASAFYHPSFESIIPEMLDSSELVKGNSIFKFIETFTTFVGPSIGGLLIGFFGNVETLFVTMFTFFISLVSILLIKKPYITDNIDNEISMIKSIKEGLYFVLNNKVIMSGTLYMFLINISYGFIESLFVFYLKGEKHFSPSIIGYIFSIQTLGSMASLFIVNKFKQINRGKFIVYSGAVMCFGMLLLALGNNIYIIVISRILIVGTATCMAISWFTLRQEVVPQQYLGRVISSTRMVAFLSLPISGMIAGLLINVITANTVFWLSTIFAIILTACYLKSNLTLYNRNN